MNTCVRFIVAGEHCCATKHFHIVDSDMQLNNTHRTYCYISTATDVTRTHHNVTLLLLLLEAVRNVMAHGDAWEGK